MNGQMSPEVFWMAATAAMTAVLWAPHIFGLIAQMGLIPALMDGQHETPLEKKWAQRGFRAHRNATANLAIFAPLAIGVHLVGAGTEMTAMACGVYFFARFTHYFVYLFGLPLVRTLSFAVGVGCQLLLAWRLLTF